MPHKLYKICCIVLFLAALFFITPTVYASINGVDISYNEAENTIYVKQLKANVAASVTLQDISNELVRPDLLFEESPGVWLLRANIWVKGKETTSERLVTQITGSTVTWLKLSSGPGGFVFFRSYNANVLIRNTKITSWDETEDTYDRAVGDGRSYVLAKYNARMDIYNSELSYLGYHAGESYGVSWRLSKGNKDRYFVTGIVEDSIFQYNYYGAYTYGADGMEFRRNEFAYNIEYGLDPHDDSNNFIVEDNTAYENGNHGIIFSRRCINNVIRNNTAHHNARSGIMLDRDSNNNTVIGNNTYKNVNGIALYSSHNNTVEDNKVHENNRGILAKDGSNTNKIIGNEIYKQETYGIYFYSGAGSNTISENNIYKNKKYGIYIKTSENGIGPDNEISSNQYGVYLYTEDATNNRIHNNLISKSTSDGVRIKLAKGNVIEKNIVRENQGSAISLSFAQGNTIKDNTNTRNAYHGVYIKQDSNNNNVIENTLDDNDGRGIYIHTSKNNIINKNLIQGNGSYAVYLYAAEGNVLEKNSMNSNARNYYYSKQNSHNTIKDTDENIFLKMNDYDSSIDIVSSDNFIYNNLRNVPTQLEETQSILTFHRGITSSIVVFEKILLQAVPVSGNGEILVLEWDSLAPLSLSWKASVPDTNFTLGQIPPANYQLLVDGNLINIVQPDGNGEIHFSYDGGGIEHTFEIIPL